ncbi:hypothetical protein EVAR_35507_1 [Eumeta japonica]|uniref:Uncharacterized protein n=1 Tax=Eumeta variegata TaxID=151549 RepID=A0A4C1X4S8_EUMVA|nr:hypothetical protein EVAR_35507_1 [Eumeta japonica]
MPASSPPLFKRPIPVKVPDFYQPRNQKQVDCERVVLTDVEEHASDTRELLIELEVDELGEPRETSDIVYVTEILPREDTQHDTTSQVLSNLAALVTVSTNQTANTHHVITFADVHVSAGEDMPSSSRTFRVSSLNDAHLDPESKSDSEYSNEGDAKYHVTSAPMEVQQNLLYDEDLPSDVAMSIRLIETVMDTEQEKLSSGYVNFK